MSDQNIQWLETSLDEVDRRRLLRNLKSSQLAGRVFVKRILIGVPAITALLFATTLTVSNDSWKNIATIWGLVGLGFTSWSLTEHWIGIRRFSKLTQNILKTNQCRKIIIKSSKVWRIRDQITQNSAYLFEQPGDKIIAFIGQDPVGPPTFPSVDFEYREILNSENEVFEPHFKPNAPKTRPHKTLELQLLPDELCAGSPCLLDGTIETVAAHWQKSPNS